MKSGYLLLFAIFFSLVLSANVFAQDATSDIISAGGEAGNINYLLKQAATINVSSDGMQVWAFTVRDGGALNSTDLNDTYVDNITIGQGSSNTASNWGTAIKKAAVFDGSGLQMTNGNTTVTGNSFLLDVLFNMVVFDGTSQTFYLVITFDNSVVDNSHFEFKVTSANAEGSFGTTFAAANGGGPSSSATLSVNRIVVSSNALAISAYPSEVSALTAFSLTVSAVDANSNVDADAAASVTLYKEEGLGSLTTVSSSLTQSLVSGTYTWTDLLLSDEDTVYLATTNNGGLTNDTTSIIDVLLGIFVDHFNYPPVSNLTSNGWTAFSNAGNTPIKTSGSSLSYPGYSSAIGVKAFLDNVNSAEDVYYNFPSQSANKVFVSCLVSVNQAATNGSYFLTLAPTSPSSSSVLKAAMHVRTTFTDHLSFGVSKTITGTPTYSDTVYSTGNTYLLAVKYLFNPGTNDDVVSLYINPALETYGEDSPTVTASSGDDLTDASSLGAVTLNQVSGSNSPEIDVDAIRVSTAWANGGLPVQFTNFAVSAMGSGVYLSWTTKSEVDNAGFEIERRDVAVQTGSNWLKTVFIPGAGTSTSERPYSFVDANLLPGRYAYRIKQIDRNGSFTYYREAEVEVGAAARQFALNDAYPNPFNPTTTIDFTLDQSDRAVLKVYNVLGQEVATLFDGMAEAGRVTRATWNAASIPSGMYFARLESGGKSGIKKLMLLK